jgi:hypothetical protein
MRRFAKSLSVERRSVGSNPTYSAKDIEDTAERSATGFEHRGGVKARGSIPLSSSAIRAM